MFIPPHCPNKECSLRYRPPEGRWYTIFGYYDTDAFGRVTRYQCKKCRKTFSSQTFSIDYYVKKPIDYGPIFQRINSSAGLRNIERHLGVSVATVSNRIARLARNAIIAHERFLDEVKIREDMIIDGFESFCESQFFPDNFNIVVGRDSQFVYLFNYSHLRRKGRMTPPQKVKRAIIEMIWKPSPKAVERAFGELCRWVVEKSADRTLPVVVGTDEKTDYVRAILKDPICREAFLSGRMRHHRTSSKLPRTRWNPLFAVNYIDREMRKDMGAHVRETVKFNRNVNDGMLRMSLYLFEHNYMKPYRIGVHPPEDEPHAAHVFRSGEPWREWTRDIFAKRFFWRLERRELDGPGRVTLERGWLTPPGGARESPPKWMSA